MKTSEDIRIQAQLISSIQIDQTTCFEWVNNEIENIVYDHYKAGKYKKEEVTTTSKLETVTLENEIVMLDKVIDANGDMTTDFDLNGKNEITISIPGKYEIRYYTMPAKPQTRTTEIDMPTQYINALKFFIAARIRARLFGQADGNAVSFFEEYKSAIDNADKSMNRQRSRYKRMPPSYRGV